MQRADAGVDERVAGVAGDPCVLEARVGLGVAQAVEGGVHVVELNLGLVLELLHEVAPPAEPFLKRRDRAKPAWVDLDIRPSVGAEHREPVARGVVALADGDRAPRQMRAEA